jgi:putative transposase
LYQCFGISKQAYYQRIKAFNKRYENGLTIKKLIQDFRQDQTNCGIRKMYEDLKPLLEQHGIKMGRDGVYDIARAYDLLVKKTKLYHITTDSKHGYYKSPNLIKDLFPTRAEQVFVADITYIRIENDWAYLALVTDLYSKKIMGYCIADNMKTPMVLQALKMALKNCVHNNKDIIHHSDRGIQYCCTEYAKFAADNNIRLSTTEKYDPYENAVAERINGILKYEYGLVKTIPTLDIAKKMVDQAVEIYNDKRRHWSLNLKTPNFAHSNQQHDYVSYKRGVDKRVKC